MGCFDELRIPWMAATDLSPDNEMSGERLSEDFRQIDKWANLLENHSASGGTLDVVMFLIENGITLDEAGGAVENTQFPGSFTDANGDPMSASAVYATAGAASSTDIAPFFDGTGDGFFLHSVSGRYSYQDNIARTERVLQTQLQQDSLLPPGPPQDQNCVDSEETWFTHTGFTYTYPSRVAIHNLSAHPCFITNIQFSITRVVTDIASFTKVV